VGTAILVEYYNELPEPHDGDEPKNWARRFDAALESYRKKVKARYNEGTLQRLLDSPDSTTRRAAVLALSTLGTMNCNHVVAARLHDDDPVVQRLAGETLWSIWFRGDTEANNRELKRLMQLRDLEQATAGLDALIKKAPTFAEAYNQRAIRSFQARDYPRAAADCEKVLQLNPHHFGAAAGLARCYLNMRRPKAALKAFREAYKIHPNLEGVEEAIRDLENALGEEGKK
jgi:tetratricopeptide (TPR) repeat protein